MEQNGGRQWFCGCDKKLGVCLRKWLGGKKNLHRAVDFYLQAAKRHSVTAARHLGKLYLAELGETKAGLQWLTLSAARNDPQSMFILASWLGDSGADYLKADAVYYYLAASKFFKEGSYYQKTSQERAQQLSTQLSDETIAAINMRIYEHDFSVRYIDHETFEDDAFRFDERP